MFDDLEDLPAEFPELVRQARVNVPGRTTYRHTTSGRRYVVARVSDTSVILEAISGHARDLHPSALTAETWELVTA